VFPLAKDALGSSRTLLTHSATMQRSLLLMSTIVQAVLTKSKSMDRADT